MTKKHYSGFTLIEMAVVLVIVGLLVSAFLAPLSTQRDIKDYSEVSAELEQIREALYGYAVINGRLPCPTFQTDPALAGYGEEAANCAAPAAEGYLPWKTLGMQEIDNWGTKRTVAANPWNGYWRYRVHPNAATVFTLATSFTTLPLSVRDSAGSALTINAESPLAIVYSAGKNLNPDGQNAVFDGIYESDVPSPNFDDVTIWIGRPVLMNRMVAAQKLP